MMLTLLICGTAIAVTALFVVAKPADAVLIGEPSGVPLSDPAAETLADNSGSHNAVPMRGNAAPKAASPVVADAASATDVPATDMKFCSIDNPDCEACQ